jgi:hypothetical protein
MNDVVTIRLNHPSPLPASSRGTVVVWGLLASFPFGGMTWQVLHHLAGLRRIGFDVWYVEDSDRPVYSATSYLTTEDTTANVAYLARYMELVGLADRWIFRTPGTRECSGARDFEGLMRLYRDAGAVLNLCGAQEQLAYHDAIRCLAYLQTDPVADQVAAASGDDERIRDLARYDFLFSYGSNLGAADCLSPTAGYRWIPTWPPVCVDWWRGAPPPTEGAAMTTVAKWSHTGKDVTWRGETWHWSKDYEFRAFMDLPDRSPLPLEMAVSSIDGADLGRLREHGWRTLPSATAKDPPAYRAYIQGSLGEFTVAKEQYVRPRSGWFSDRSVCYLAAGRPVVMQATGFEKRLPVGEGLLAFRNTDEAVDALTAVAGDYGAHARAASEIAREYFGAERVLEAVMKEMGL